MAMSCDTKMDNATVKQVVDELANALQTAVLVATRLESQASAATARLTSFTLRQCRYALALSQSRFAAQLGVSLETYRTWDSASCHKRSTKKR